MNRKFEIESIGVIRSPFKSKDETPIQGAFSQEAAGSVELFPEFKDGLRDLEGFEMVHLLYLFDRAGEVRMVRKTFLSDEPKGLFSSRHPCRPSRIGLTIAKLVSVDVEKGRLELSGIDVLDGTPLLDIKPYIPKFDSFPDAAAGWFADVKNRSKPAGRE